ncbi:MAG: DJ-1/PfpI family protein [Chloroflexi bacterium]|nr:DJ-1/PfpI family protein [Chloroflexota bacterium]
MDALIKADKAWALIASPDAQRLFDIRLVGLNHRPVRCRDGVRLHPADVAREIRVPDPVVVPGLDDDLEESFSLNRGWAAWIARWHAAGAHIASSCTGAFLVAESGVLNGRPPTTHWMFAGELIRRYPNSRPTGRSDDR